MHRPNFRSFLNSVVVLNIGAQILQAIFAPLLTFFFDTDQFGSWVILLASAGVVGIVSSLRLDQALQLSNSKEELDQIVFTGRIFSVVIPWLLFLISMIVLPQRIQFCLQCATLASLIGLNAIQIAKSYKIKHYKRVIIGQTFISLGFPVFAILFVKVFETVFSLFYACVIGYIFSILINLEQKISIKQNIIGSTLELVRFIPTTLHNCKKYLLFSLPSTLLNLIKEQIPLYTLLVLSGNSAVAVFSLGMRIVYIPSSLFTSVLRPKFANQLTDSFNRNYSSKILASEIREVMRFLGILLSFLVTVLYTFTDYFVQSAFNEGWDKISDVIKVLGILMIPQVLIGWLDRTLDLMGKQVLLMKYEFSSIVLLIIAFFTVTILKFSSLIYMSIYSGILFLLYLYLMVVVLELNRVQKQFALQIMMKLLIQVSLQLAAVFLLKMLVSEVTSLVFFVAANLIILKKASIKLPKWFW